MSSTKRVYTLYDLAKVNFKKKMDLLIATRYAGVSFEGDVLEMFDQNAETLLSKYTEKGQRVLYLSDIYYVEKGTSFMISGFLELLTLTRAGLLRKEGTGIKSIFYQIESRELTTTPALMNAEITMDVFELWRIHEERHRSATLRTSQTAHDYVKNLHFQLARILETNTLQNRTEREHKLKQKRLEECDRKQKECAAQLAKWSVEVQEREECVVASCGVCSSNISQSTIFVRTEHNCNGAGNGTGICFFHKRCWFKTFRKRFGEICKDCGHKLDTVITIDHINEHHHKVKRE